MIDDMVALLNKEQVDDDSKKEYCEKLIDKTEDDLKALELTVSDLGKAIADYKESIATLAEEIEALEDGIKALDKQVAEATEERKEEHEENVATLENDRAAKEIIGVAKNRLNKFYNPKLYKSPTKDLSDEDRATLAAGGTLAPTAAGFVQQLPPPPAAVEAYSKKSEQS